MLPPLLHGAHAHAHDRDRDQCRIAAPDSHRSRPCRLLLPGSLFGLHRHHAVILVAIPIATGLRLRSDHWHGETCDSSWIATGDCHPIREPQQPQGRTRSRCLVPWLAVLSGRRLTPPSQRELRLQMLPGDLASKEVTSTPVLREQVPPWRRPLAPRAHNLELIGCPCPWRGPHSFARILNATWPRQPAALQPGTRLQGRAEAGRNLVLAGGASAVPCGQEQALPIGGRGAPWARTL